MLGQPIRSSMVTIPNNGDKIRNNNTKCVLGLAITHIFIGITLCILQLLLICFKSRNYFVAQGVWSGLFFIITGIWGIKAATTKTVCFLQAFLVFCIFSTFIAIVVYAFTTADLSHAQYAIRYYNRDKPEVPQSAKPVPNQVTPFEKPKPPFREPPPATPDFPALSVSTVTIMMLALSALHFVLTIISSGFACHGLCCSHSHMVSENDGLCCGHSHMRTVMLAGDLHVVRNTPTGMILMPVGYSRTPSRNVQGREGIWMPGDVSPSEPLPPSYEETLPKVSER